jgi:hypothetical protein
VKLYDCLLHSGSYRGIFLNTCSTPEAAREYFQIPALPRKLQGNISKYLLHPGSY